MLFSGALMTATACTHVPWGPAVTADTGGGSSATESAGGGALAWWGRAMDAGAGARESMLKNARQAKSAWRVAMLRSIPGGAEAESPDASQEALRGLLRRGLRDEEATLTRIRIAELEQAKTCQSETFALRSRLNRIIEIEKDIGNGR